MFQFPSFTPVKTGPWALPQVGCPIRVSPDQSLFTGSPKLIAGYHALPRLPTPRHPPFALSSLTTSTQERLNEINNLLAINFSKITDRRFDPLTNWWR